MFTAKLPGNRLMIDFGKCTISESRRMEFRLLNQAKELPIRYTLPRVAHFIPRPASSVIKPNSQMKISVEFVPKQYGYFETNQHVLVLGSRIDPQTGKKTDRHVIYETSLVFRGACVSEKILPSVRFNPGQ
ncbi:hypothetical protein EG68_06390 [Paragonimus skrjabini miyazakii]|uniref:HYDIN/VesB/CFA65-like Ig-like domain-containing protein n=1 Tax=Paragonimus skrjabini miyazakii TaxID=59628 RepID=A0A8S9YSI4_9TREM|nr:hypothetical protein EG68_06390 [Paragonimus skrjabini miyazakii]